MQRAIIVVGLLGCSQPAELTVIAPNVLFDPSYPVYRLRAIADLGDLRVEPQVENRRFTAIFDAEPGPYDLMIRFEGAASADGRVLPVYEATRGVVIADSGKGEIQLGEVSEVFFDADDDGVSNIQEIARGWDPDASPLAFEVPVGNVGAGDLHVLSDGAVLYFGPLESQRNGLRVVEPSGAVRWSAEPYRFATARGTKVYAVHPTKLTIDVLALPDGTVELEIPFGAHAPDLAGAPWAEEDGLIAPLSDGRILEIDRTGTSTGPVALPGLDGCTLGVPPFQNDWQTERAVVAFAECPLVTEIVRIEDGATSLAALSDARAGIDRLLAVGADEHAYVPSARFIEKVELVTGTVRWRAEIGSLMTRPRFSGDRLFAISDALVALDPVSGAELFRAEAVPGADLGPSANGRIAFSAMGSGVAGGRIVGPNGEDVFFFGRDEGFAKVVAGLETLYALGNGKIVGVSLPR